jgi:acylphosphatase
MKSAKAELICGRISGRDLLPGPALEETLGWGFEPCIRGIVMGNIRLRLIIEGRVQGVWFRESTRKEAERLGICGWVRNRPEGTVEVVAEGEEEKVRKLAAWCRHGPRSARVLGVHEAEEVFRGEFGGFHVAY